MSYSINTKEKERTSLTVAMAATATRGITARMEQNSNYFDGGCHPTTMYWQPPQQQQQQQPLQQSLLQPKTGLVKPIPRRVAAAAAAVVPKRHLRTTDTSPSRSRCRMNRGRSRSPCRVGEFERTMTEAAVVASAGTTTSRVTPVAELFYGATEKAQIPLTRVHQAAQQSHDWESTWVHALHKVNPIDERRRHQQTEEEDDDRGFPYDATLEAYLSGDRVDGARNPSPSLSLTRTTSKEEEERLPLPVSTSLLQRKERLVQSPSAPPPQSKGPVQEAPYGRMVIAAAPGPVLCRPIALRVGQQPHPQQERSEHFTIPREIMDSLRGTGTSAIVDVSSSSSRRSLSPMTMFSNNTSRSSHNNGSWGEYVPLSSSSQSLQSQPGQYYPPQSQFAVEMQNGPHAAQPQPVLIEDDNDNEHNATTITTTTPFGGVVPAVLPTTLTMTAAVQEARDGMLIALAVSGGDTDTPQFRDCLSVLQDSFLERRRAAAAAADLDLPYADHEGTWLSLTKPTFFGCLGENDQNDPMYTIGRMTFDMFQPSNLICSLQGNFNVVERIDAVPDCLVAQVGTDASVLRTYNIITAFTIEASLAEYPDAPNKAVHRPIRGIMTTAGYMMVDPKHDEDSSNNNSHRHSLWITGGTMMPNDCEQDVTAWKKFFGTAPARSLGVSAKLLALKWLMGAVVKDGMDPDTGCLEYTFTRPIGGHGKAYTDTLYADDSLRILRGHRGTYFVFSKVPDYHNPTQPNESKRFTP